MKFNRISLSVLALILVFSASLFAQDKEMTKEEWQNEMTSLTAKKADLQKELETLTAEVNELKKTSEGLQSYEDCQKDLYAVVGATNDDVAKFQSELDALTAQINKKQMPKKDRQAALDAMKASKISALPAFYDQVHNVLQRKLDAWEVKPEVILYTVVKGDNLWNIAKKKEHYGNGFAWPKIYNANRDQIKNPDLIYPKQVFKIPNLTDEEKAKYNKIRANYKPAPAQ